MERAYERVSFTCEALELRHMIAELTRDGRQLAQSIR
jgi:hypothetical protein